MASEAAIKAQIEKTVKREYLSWVIGLTDNAERSRRLNGNPLHWVQWQASSAKAAQNIIRYFLGKGMNAAAEVIKESLEELKAAAVYVYIFS